MSCFASFGPAQRIAQSQLPPNADLDELLGNRQFGEDIPSLVGPNIGIDEPLLNFKSQSHFNVYRSTGELPHTIQPGLNGPAIMRDRNGQVTGYVITGHNGVQYVKDRNGRYIRHLDPGARRPDAHQGPQRQNRQSGALNENGADQ